MEHTISNERDSQLTYSLALTQPAILWLAGKTMTDDGTSVANSFFLFSLLSRIKTHPHKDESFRRPQPLLPCQIQLSELQLAEKWRIGRRRVHTILICMQRLGLLDIQFSRTATVATLICVKGWTTAGGLADSNPSISIS